MLLTVLGYVHVQQLPPYTVARLMPELEEMCREGIVVTREYLDALVTCTNRSLENVRHLERVRFRGELIGMENLH